MKPLFATDERVLLQEEAVELARAISTSELALEYQQALENVRSNESTQEKIRAFLKWRDLYDDVQRFGKYHPDYKKISKEVRMAKREMDLDDEMSAFKRAETSLQSVLDEVSLLVGHAVSEHVKVTTGNPFFTSASSCSGGCGSGGSCQCSA